MITTRKLELNKLINKISELTHQNKLSSKRVSNDGDRNSKGTFTVKGPDKKSEYYMRDGSKSTNINKVEVPKFDNHFYMEKICALENEKKHGQNRDIYLLLLNFLLENF